MYCEKCGSQINDNANYCPNCGCSQKVQLEKKHTNTYSILSIIFGVISFIPFLNFLFLPVAGVFAVLSFVKEKHRGKKGKIASIIVLILSITIALLWVIPTINGSSSISPENCVHSYIRMESEANCEKGGYTIYKCSLCEDLYSEYEDAYGHLENNGICLRCGESIGNWEIAFYVDEFNNPTSDAYVRTTNFCTGVFSNSATTNSLLYARILIDEEGIEIVLWEYGNNLVETFITTNYNITVLDNNGDKHFITGTMYENGDRICLSGWNLVGLLQNSEKLEIYLQEDAKYGIDSTYLFTVESSNFNSVYAEYYNEYMS